MAIIEVIIKIGVISAIIIGVLAVLFGFAFLGDALGELLPSSGISGQPFYIVGWVIVAIVIVLLIAVVVKFVTDR